MDNPTGFQNPRLAEKRGASAGMITGAVLVAAGMVIRIVGVPLATMLVFHELGDSGIGDPHAIASRISLLLDISIASLCLAGAGVIVLVVSLVVRWRKANDPVRQAQGLRQ